MAAPAKVSDEQIIAAGKSLVAVGRRVSGVTLREIVGHGRPERLLAVWQQYVATTAEQAAAEPPAPPLPTTLEARIHEQADLAGKTIVQLGGLIWSVADQIAADRTKSEIESARATSAAAVEDLEGASQIIGALEAAAETAAAEISELRSDLQEAEHALASQTGRAEASESRAARLDEALRCAVAAGAVADAAAAEADRRRDAVQADLVQEQRDRRAAEAAADQLQIELAVGKTDIARHAEARTQAEALAADLRLRAESASAAAAAAKAQAEAATARAETAEQRLASAESAARNAALEHGRLLQRAENAEAALERGRQLQRAEREEAAARIRPEKPAA